MDYTKRYVIQCGKAVPTSAGVESRVGATESFAVWGLEATVMVEGAQATHALKLFSSAGAVLATCAIGTSAVGTSIRATVDVDEAIIDADDYVYVASLVNDASAAYSWRLIGNLSL